MHLPVVATLAQEEGSSFRWRLQVPGLREHRISTLGPALGYMLGGPHLLLTHIAQHLRQTGACWALNSILAGLSWTQATWAFTY